jgi:hypothetical protein
MSTWLAEQLPEKCFTSKNRWAKTRCSTPETKTSSNKHDSLNF